jgi:hypothetical protein
LLVTFFPLFPLLSVPRLRRRIADSTSFEALFEVFRFAVLEQALRHGLREHAARHQRASFRVITDDPPNAA